MTLADLARAEAEGRTEAARHILRLADLHAQDLDRMRGVDALAEHAFRTAWLVRELRRAAKWAATGSDPGDGYNGGFDVIVQRGSE